MYAILKNGGKQYRVTIGQIIKLEKINHKIGDIIQFNQVLMISDNNKINIGTPYLNQISIQGSVIDQGRNKKIHIIKFRRRKHYKKQQGHRQFYTSVKIQEIKNNIQSG
ncbi:50S ribosomal protein L21 [Buchnera aphidicola (Eriosoma grossulariae)]|uniref:50S ribosomal protein L21 n=1 Tax=Buchnera aphidicola TaxID=9 RepID=UPI003464B134